MVTGQVGCAKDTLGVNKSEYLLYSTPKCILPCFHKSLATSGIFKSMEEMKSRHVGGGQKLRVVSPITSEGDLEKIHYYQGKRTCRFACIQMNRRWRRLCGAPVSLPRDLFNSRVEAVVDLAKSRRRGPILRPDPKMLNAVIAAIEKDLMSGYLPPILVSHRRGLHYVCAYALIKDESGKAIGIKFLDPGSLRSDKKFGVLMFDEEAGNFVRPGKKYGNTPDLSYYLLGVHPMGRMIPSV